MTTNTNRPATAKQLAYITSLQDDIRDLLARTTVDYGAWADQAANELRAWEYVPAMLGDYPAQEAEAEYGSQACYNTFAIGMTPTRSFTANHEFVCGLLDYLGEARADSRESYKEARKVAQAAYAQWLRAELREYRAEQDALAEAPSDGLTVSQASELIERLEAWKLPPVYSWIA